MPRPRAWPISPVHRSCTQGLCAGPVRAPAPAPSLGCSSARLPQVPQHCGWAGCHRLAQSSSAPQIRVLATRAPNERPRQHWQPWQLSQLWQLSSSAAPAHQSSQQFDCLCPVSGAGTRVAPCALCSLRSGRLCSACVSATSTPASASSGIATKRSPSCRPRSTRGLAVRRCPWPTNLRLADTPHARSMPAPDPPQIRP